MGIFSGIKKAGSYIFNFRVDQWISFDLLKENTQSLVNTGKNVFKIDKAKQTETFDEAMTRLGLTEQDLKQRIWEFQKLMFFWVLAGILIFSYGCYLGFFGFLSAFLICLALTAYSAIQAFRYHFWIFQIRQRKLGCTIQEWLNSKTLDSDLDLDSDPDLTSNPNPNSNSNSSPNSNPDPKPNPHPPSQQ